jgi:hypothetical protein
VINFVEFSKDIIAVLICAQGHNIVIVNRCHHSISSKFSTNSIGQPLEMVRIYSSELVKYGLARDTNQIVLVDFGNNTSLKVLTLKESVMDSKSFQMVAAMR